MTQLTTKTDKKSSQKFEAAWDLLTDKTISVAKFEKILLLLEGFNPQLDKLLTKVGKQLKKLEQIYADISVADGYAHFEGIGAGHFVKMVHNGIEYGMMQAIGEGFNVMKKSEYNLDLAEVARVYSKKSVIESRLIGWLEKAYKEFGPDLNAISGAISHSGEGKWTVETAEEMGQSVPVIKDSYEFRVASQQKPSYIGKVVSALRGQFGGHAVKKK